MFRPKLLRILAFALIASMFCLALRILHHDLSHYHFKDLSQSFKSLSNRQIFSSALLTLLSYILLTFYDVLALFYLKERLAYSKAALASFLAYVFSYNIGLSILGSGSVRYRLYSNWGLGPIEIGKLIAFSALSFWLGVLSLAGLVFILNPLPLPSFVQWGMTSTLPIGFFLLLAISFYLGATSKGTRLLRLKGESFALPPLKTSILQIVLASADIMCAAAVLYSLLPEQGTPEFFSFLNVYILALFLGLISHVPGGIGVFETVMFFFLKSKISEPQLLSSLLAYRLLYYLLPFLVGLLLYAGFELKGQKEGLWRFANWSQKTLMILAPRILAAASFAGGSLLLLSGSTPAMPERLHWLRSMLPLALIEASHFLGSLVGIFLLILARGLLRKLDIAFHLTIVSLLAGIILSLLKGLDYEEALILGLLLLAFLPSRSSFYRKASLFADRFSLEWILLVVMVLGSSLWLGFFSYKHVEYSHELWWTFAFHADAPRFLRASIGTSGLILAIGLARLFRPAKPVDLIPKPEELIRVRSLALAHSRTLAQMVFLGDKPILIHDSGAAFLMYGIYGRSWVCLGGPIGADDTANADLLWDFRELCDEHGAWEVYYQVHPHSLPLLSETGLAFVKLGEEAIVDLQSFSLEGNSRKSLRHSHGRSVKLGLRFEIIDSTNVAPLLPELQKISDAWLKTKNSSEKGFSLGKFSAEYICQTAFALVLLDGRVIGFANILASNPKSELSIDLMRYLPDAPPGLMDYLFCQLMIWGRKEGFLSFNFGMAPLSGIENRPLAPLWNRFASFLFQHGEHFYNFQGIRSYKEKFHPKWEPRYLAYHPSASLPVVLTQVAALVAGGMKEVLRRS